MCSMQFRVAPGLCGRRSLHYRLPAGPLFLPACLCHSDIMTEMPETTDSVSALTNVIWFVFKRFKKIQVVPVTCSHPKPVTCNLLPCEKQNKPCGPWAALLSRMKNTRVGMKITNVESSGIHPLDCTPPPSPSGGALGFKKKAHKFSPVKRNIFLKGQPVRIYATIDGCFLRSKFQFVYRMHLKMSENTTMDVNTHST